MNALSRLTETRVISTVMQDDLCEGVLLHVTYTERDNRTRVISAGRAEKHEQDWKNLRPVIRYRLEPCAIGSKAVRNRINRRGPT